MTLPGSIKPENEVRDALELLVDFLLTQIRTAPVSPDGLIARVNASPPEYLAAVKGHMRRAGFLDGNELSRSALYHILKIDVETGVGTRVLLTERAGGLALHYFPGYTLKTPLRQFLMQELTDYPRIRIDITGGRTRVVRPRRDRVGQLERSIYDAKQRYQRITRLRVDVSARRLTIGEFLTLPPDVVERCPMIYEMLTRYGFSQGTGLARR